VQTIIASPTMTAIIVREKFLLNSEKFIGNPLLYFNIMYDE
jgi:hypothetical protein